MCWIQLAQDKDRRQRLLTNPYRTLIHNHLTTNSTLRTITNPRTVKHLLKQQTIYPSRQELLMPFLQANRTPNTAQSWATVSIATRLVAF